MGTVVVIGGTRTFSALFLNATGVPNDVIDPEISVIQYVGVNSTFWIDHQTMVKASPPETGQYVFVWNVPSTLTNQGTLYVRFEGTDPTSGNELFQEELVEVQDAEPDPHVNIFATFVRGG